MKLMYPQNDKIGILEVFKIKNFLHCPTMVDRLIKNFCKILRILHWWHLCKVIEESKNSVIYFSTITRILEISEGK